MKIREFKEKDRRQVIKISEELKEWFNKEGRESIKIDLKANKAIVAEDKEGKILGFLIYLIYNRKFIIAWFGVKKDSQRKNIGGKMLQWLEKRAKKFKIKYMDVETLSDKYKYKPYVITRNFYYKMGFKKVSVIKPVFKGWDEEILMRKKLF